MECILFEKRLCFKPKYIHFVYSFLAYVAFSSCLRREDQFVLAVFCFFFFTRSTRTCRCHSKWSFCGSSVFLVVKNPHDLRSQIRFWILPKKRRHPICFREGCSVQSSLLPPPYWKTRRPCGQGWTFYVDIHRNIAKGIMAVSVWFRF